MVKKRHVIWMVAIAGILALVAVLLAALALFAHPNESPLTTIENLSPSEIIELPPGFESDLYAAPTEVSQPTVIAFGPDNKLYLLSLNGSIFVFEDGDNDHYAETVRRVFSDPSSDSRRVQLGLAADSLVHAVGMAFHENILYVSDSGRISRLTDADDDGILDTLTPVVEGLVSLRMAGNSNNGIAFGPDGKLYVGVGATTDHGPIQEPMEAAILRMNPDGSDLEDFATGLRNPYDLTFSPDGDLFTADNNPGQLDKSLRYIPPEELDHIREGRDYGFPSFFGYPPLGSGTEPPVTEFFPSVASAGLVYYAANQFPEHYRNGIFVAQWGTGSESSLSRGLDNGHMVVFVTLQKTDDGTYRGDWEEFARFNSGEQVFRPIDVTVGPDGALYVAEFMTSRIFRITYTGNEQRGSSPIVSSPSISTTETNMDVLALGESLFLDGVEGAPACVSCHSLDRERQGLGPSLYDLRNADPLRTGELNITDYIRQAILEPNAYIARGYNADYMFQNYADYLTSEQVEALVGFVLSLSASH